MSCPCSCSKFLMLVAAILAWAACGSGTTGPTDPPGTVRITLTTNLRFDPADVTIAPGTPVRWVNAASLVHTVTPDDPNQAGVWPRATTSSSGSVLLYTFPQSSAGQTYAYFCEPHLADGMTGIIRVQ